MDAKKSLNNKANGRYLCSPEIIFHVDEQNKAIYPTSYRQDDMGMIYETEDVSPEVVRDLKEFMSEWFTNISQQGFELAELEEYEAENEEVMEC